MRALLPSTCLSVEQRSVSCIPGPSLEGELSRIILKMYPFQKQFNRRKRPKKLLIPWCYSSKSTHSHFFCRNKAMLMIVFGKYCSFFSETLFCNMESLSWVPMRPFSTSVGDGAQSSPASLRDTTSTGESGLGSCMCCTFPRLSLLNREDWGKEAALNQRKEQWLYEEGVKECRVKAVFKGNESLLPKKKFLW